MARGIFVFFLLTVLNVTAQDTTALRYASYIQPEIIRRHLSVLASDSLEGRETATEGMVKAARYVSQQFAAMGIPPCNNGSYYQKVPLVKQMPGSTKLKLDGRELKYGDEYFAIDAPPSLNFSSSEIIFVGYGIEDSASGWNDYRNIDVSGKLIFMLDGEPVNKKGVSLISGSKESSKWKNDRQTKIEIATGKNVAGIFLVHQEYQKTFERINKRLSAGRLMLDDSTAQQSIPVMYISNNLGNVLLEKAGKTVESWKKKSMKKKTPDSFSIQCKSELINNSEKTSCNNVMGFIEGTSKKEEVLIITAHLDHLGKRDDKIYYGADDDGSGSSSILNIAEAFVKAKKEGNSPKRSILVMTFTGEEKGLYGSEYYSNNPIFPLSNTVVDLNIDMIGRVDSVKRDSPYYTYIIGSDKLSTTLHAVNETANKFCCNLELDYKYNDPSDKLKLYYRSDHYNFAKHNIPVIFYFTGLHDDYHKPTDTIDKIDFDKTAKIARLVFNTAWELANRDEKIQVDVKNVFK